MTNRKQRAEIAAETIALLESEQYTVDGSIVSLATKLDAMRRGTVLYTPADLESLLDSLPTAAPSETAIAVKNCSTFAAAKSLIDGGYPSPLCLNFASAKNPGGGFLSGSQAQEECLARGSGLYQSLSRVTAYYDANRVYPSSLYTNHLIYSPSVPVFRKDNDSLLSEPYAVSVATCPAVNAAAVRRNEPDNVSQLQPTMEKRIRSVLAVARKHQHTSLVLGAWGCGVFGNNPSEIAQWFAEALFDDQRFAGAFEQVVFAVLDFAQDTPTYDAFRDVFASN